MLRILNPGAIATLQDLGREGYTGLGVPVSGAMDKPACVIANRVVGNTPDEACVELLGHGATFLALKACAIAVTGRDVHVFLNGRSAPGCTSLFVRPGTHIEINGRRAYLALAGGIDAPLVLGSRSAYVQTAGIGHMLQGDEVLAARHYVDPIRVSGRHWLSVHLPKYAPVLRLLPGPHTEWFDADALTVQPWQISATSNRTGLRLTGKTLKPKTQHSIPSLGVFAGVVQVPPDGQPILLMADAQPTGGYPIIAVVIQADLHKAAQLLPGETAHLEWTTHDGAVFAWRTLQTHLASALAEDDWQLNLAAIQG